MMQNLLWASLASAGTLTAVLVSQPGGPEADGPRGHRGPEEFEPPHHQVELPATARDAVMKAYPDANIEETELKARMGMVVFEVELSRGGGELEVEVTADGTILAEVTDSSADALPEVISKALAGHPAGEVEQRKVLAEFRPVKLDQPRTEYVIEMPGQEITLDAEGRMISMRRFGPPPRPMGGPGMERGRRGEHERGEREDDDREEHDDD